MTSFSEVNLQVRSHFRGFDLIVWMLVKLFGLLDYPRYAGFETHRPSDLTLKGGLDFHSLRVER